MSNPNPPGHGHPLQHLLGKVKSVTPPTIAVTGQDGADHTFTTEARTKVFLDHQPSTLDKLKAGWMVVVSSDAHGHVHEVSARSH